MVHAAFNLITGEVLTSTRANTLKRRVKHYTAWDVAHGYDKGKWVFAHGSHWTTKFIKKFEAHRN